MGKTKPKHAVLNRCKCGGFFQKQTSTGAWYWCLYCDAHVTDCKAKGAPGRCRCQLIGAA